MGNGTQILQCMPFFLQRIVRRGVSLHIYITGMYFKRLLCLRCQNQYALYNYCRTHIQLGNFRKVFDFALFENNLQPLEAAAVIYLYESKSLGIPKRSNPSANSNLLVFKGLLSLYISTISVFCIHILP